MVEESSPLVPPAEETIEAETDALDPERESGEPAPEPASVRFDCSVWMRWACTGLAFYKEHEGKRYCVLHYPGKEKRADFKAALHSKLNKKDFDFRGVWFPDPVDFRGFEFSAEADFSSATFSAEADFSSATFSAAAYFSSATFSAAAYFSSATFSAAASFSSATFSADAAFSSATFSAAAYFSSATFSADADFAMSLFHASVLFAGASFDGSVRFFGTATERELKDGARLAAMALGKDRSLDFQHVRIEHSNRVAFHTLDLRPHWLVNVDPREFVFTDVDWRWDRISINEEIAALEAREVSSPNRLLAITCRQLAENAETNNRYEEASNFRYWAMDLARRTKWKRWSFWKTDWLHLLYWAVSGYGERMLRALAWLVGVWIVFAILYTQVPFKQDGVE